jgi:hypothetical protein
VIQELMEQLDSRIAKVPKTCKSIEKNEQTEAQRKYSHPRLPQNNQLDLPFWWANLDQGQRD